MLCTTDGLLFVCLLYRYIFYVALDSESAYNHLSMNIEHTLLIDYMDMDRILVAQSLLAM